MGRRIQGPELTVAENFQIGELLAGQERTRGEALASEEIMKTLRG